ncbi:MEDS domain-containing protein [Pseudonocardia sp. KRD-184]|uniref:MEDS domain-containing protein n=1 Tax=Pseudonocardia oceani TaxID=2792013 RepID=A0ABS6UGY7_9PSEU|nr:MEDS domain-containing protein [Pseudonocardia oceani]MBW0088773.1 MEDS domain-containing protein [Pseudonocardia oceani]MBW0096372.1 MEDS domain-containing protein [Pseudonocardia oceani]MBW0107343.1 MEDS domain-containing protein [Pseudonocardia oceani]MBW0122440.1 MEDS domain-containing protein [Pseudonocardia oceani]MBW0131475.1 MEDS domain-containing protein [Pseudonocardia oceani]
MTSADDPSTFEQSATIGGLPVRTHDHVCVLYRGAAQRDELMAEFLADGVRAGNRCYCLITADDHRRIAAAVSARNERAAAGPASGVPGRVDFVDPGGSYVRGGGFVSDRMLRFWDEWGAATYDRDGVAHALIGADMSWAKPLVDAPGFVMDLARYETRFTVWARRRPQVTACLYDLDRFDGEVIVPVVRAHPKVWMNGVVLTNPYYLQSEYFSAAETHELSGRAAAPV